MQKVTLRVRALGMSLLAAAVLAACGGGGSDSPAPTPPPTVTVTAIPDNLAITAPATVDSATAVKFSNSAGGSSGLKYQWDFGDGGTSTEASPSHSYTNGGEFDVVLKVTNEAGTTKETRTKLAITNMANVRGLACSGDGDTGWCWQNPRPTGNRIHTVFFLNATTGWRAGDNGEIFKTTDSGTTWVRQNSGITAAIYGIKFFDANTGWATGAFGAMLRTADGGKTWNVAKYGDQISSYDLGALTVVDAKTVYVGRLANSSGAMYATKDGGVTWRTISSPPHVITSTGKLWSVQTSYSGSGQTNSLHVSSDGGMSFSQALEMKAPQGNNYYIETSSVVAAGDLRAVVYTRGSTFDYSTYKRTYHEHFHTTLDGGATWSKVEVKTLEYSTGVQNLLGISMDGKTLTAASSVGVLRSTDGGATWTVMSVPSDEPYIRNFFSLGGSDVVASSYTNLWLSEDSGQTWSKLASPVGAGLIDVSRDSMRRVDATTLCVTDSSGTTYLSKDKGQSWAKVVAPVSTSYYSQPVVLAFSDSKNGFMADSASGRNLTTKDGGATWQAKTTSFGTAKSVQFVNKTTGWLVGSDSRLYKSTDAGQSWTNVAIASGVSFNSVSFSNENLGWSQRSYGAQWAYTKDGGKTWTEMALPSGVATMRFGDQAWVAAGSAGALYVSTDSGATWNARYTGTSVQLLAAAFADAKTAWIVGEQGMVLKSEDSGAQWTRVNLPSGNATLRDIRFANAKVGWIVGDAGVVLATRDGGKTWQLQASGTNLPLYGIQVADINTAWITGVNGLVLATGTGGN